MTSDAQKKAVKKYDSEKSKFYSVKCHIVYDADIIEYLNQFDNKQAALKRLIREEIARTGKN